MESGTSGSGNLPRKLGMTGEDAAEERVVSGWGSSSSSGKRNSSSGLVEEAMAGCNGGNASKPRQQHKCNRVASKQGQGREGKGEEKQKGFSGGERGGESERKMDKAPPLPSVTSFPNPRAPSISRQRPSSVHPVFSRPHFTSFQWDALVPCLQISV